MFSLLLTTNMVPKILHGRNVLCTMHTGLHVRTMVWQSNKIKILMKTSSKLHLCFGHCTKNAMILWVFSKFCPLQQDTLATLEYNLGRLKSIKWLTRWRLAEFAPVCHLFLWASQGKLCMTYADSGVTLILLEQKISKNVLPPSSSAQRILLVLDHNWSIKIYTICLTTISYSLQGKSIKSTNCNSKDIPEFLGKCFPWTFSEISILNFLRWMSCNYDQDTIRTLSKTNTHHHPTNPDLN